MAKTTPPAATTATRGRTIRLIDMAVMMLTRLPDRWLVRTLYRLKQGGYWFASGKRSLFGALQAYSQPTRRNRQNKPEHTSRIVPITAK